MDTTKQSNRIIDLVNAVNILIKWRAETTEICDTLKISKELFMDVINERVENVELNTDQLTRIGYIICTQHKLTSLFCTPEFTYTFMSKEYNTPFFSGRSPLDVLLNGCLQDMEKVYKNVDSVALK